MQRPGGQAGAGAGRHMVPRGLHAARRKLLVSLARLCSLEGRSKARPLPGVQLQA